MNLNQQSSGPAWNWHKNLMDSLTPLVDCGVHYVDIMCQMTRAKPVRVHGIGAKLSDETRLQNYGALQVAFDDGSVGWYEAGWGPMMSEVAYFVKDVVGPAGRLDRRAQGGGQTEARRTRSRIPPTSTSTPRPTRSRSTTPTSTRRTISRARTSGSTWRTSPITRSCATASRRSSSKAIREDLDLSDWMDDAVNSLRIVLAADESIRTRRAVEL